MYQDRLAMVESEILRVELIQLERNAETNKIDHPPRGTKDLADAVCGAVYAASRSRLVRSQVGYRDPDGDPARRPAQKERPKSNPRPKGGPRPGGSTRRVSRKQAMHRDLRSREDDEFRKRYD